MLNERLERIDTDLLLQNKIIRLRIKTVLSRYKSKVNHHIFFLKCVWAARMPLEVNVLHPRSIEMVSRKNGGSLNGSDTGNIYVRKKVTMNMVVPATVE